MVNCWKILVTICLYIFLVLCSKYNQPLWNFIFSVFICFIFFPTLERLAISWKGKKPLRVIQILFLSVLGSIEINTSYAGSYCNSWWIFIMLYTMCTFNNSVKISLKQFIGIGQAVFVKNINLVGFSNMLMPLWFKILIC